MPLTQEAAVDRLGLGAESDAAGRRGAAFGEGLRVDGAVADDALVVQAAALVVLGALLRGVMSRSSASAPVHSVEHTCMFQDSAVAPQ